MPDVERTLERLDVTRAVLLNFNYPAKAEDVASAIALIKRQAAELKEQAAEIERLTPKPMTLKQACEVLTEAEFGIRSSRWIEDGDGYAICHDVDDNPRYVQDSLTERQAVLIAQGLTREKEAARG